MLGLIEDADLVIIIGRYSGLKSIPYRVVKISPLKTKITIYRPDFATRKEEFFYRPASGAYSNDYSGTLCLFGKANGDFV